MPKIASILTYNEQDLHKGLPWRRKQAHETRDKLRTIPHLEHSEQLYPAPIDNCGIYFLWKNKSIVYVGQSTAIASRVGQHAQSKDFDFYSFVPCCREALDFLESYHIHRIKPVLNGPFNKKGYQRAPMDPSEVDRILESYQRAKEL